MSGRAAAIESLRLSLGNLDGPDWSAEAVVLELRFGDSDQGQLILTAHHLTLPDPVAVLTTPVFRCDVFRLTADGVACDAGELQASSGPLGKLDGRVRFAYNRRDGIAEFSVSGVQLAGGSVEAGGRWSGKGWRITIEAASLQLTELLELAKRVGYDTGFTAGGAASLQVSGEGGDKLERVRFDGTVAGLSFSDAAGIRAGEGIHLALDGEASPAGDGWNVRTSLDIGQGQLYIDPLFLEVPDQPVHLAFSTAWSPGQQHLELQQLEWLHPGAVRARGRLAFDLEPEATFRDGDVTIENGDLSGLYGTYVKPLLLGTMGGDLDVSGEVQGRLRIADAAPEAINLRLDKVAVTDQAGRIGLQGLQGDIDWGNDDVERLSTLSWESAKLFRVAIGAAELPVRSRGEQLELARGVRLPVLDGDIGINQWRMENPGREDMRWTFDGALTPISMRSFTKALEWPTLSGKLSGMIPQVSYDAGLLKVGGVLLVRVFDGEITVRNLQLEEPFGLVPRLQADVNVKHLDLKTLTRTFSFGKIEGQLDGHVTGLRMEQWRPVAFDAELRTPDNDPARHRISQRALENLSNIGGGGVGGALSRGFLAFFEDFPYRRLGIRCRLLNGVCEMSGVAPAESGGYYIVQGRLVPPRVDVIGYANKVDWRTLIEQLVSVTTGDAAPTIQ